jgi:hypothetical protein
MCNSVLTATTIGSLLRKDKIIAILLLVDVHIAPRTLVLMAQHK